MRGRSAHFPKIERAPADARGASTRATSLRLGRYPGRGLRSRPCGLWRPHVTTGGARSSTRLAIRTGSRVDRTASGVSGSGVLGARGLAGRIEGPPPGHSWVAEGSGGPTPGRAVAPLPPSPDPAPGEPSLAAPDSSWAPPPPLRPRGPAWAPWGPAVRQTSPEIREPPAQTEWPETPSHPPSPWPAWPRGCPPGPRAHPTALGRGRSRCAAPAPASSGKPARLVDGRGPNLPPPGPAHRSSSLPCSSLVVRSQLHPFSSAERGGLRNHPSPSPPNRPTRP
jgi:hypothetical protein